MEELLIVLLQILAEVVGEVLGSGLLDLVTWSWDQGASPARSRLSVLIPLMLVLGGVLGGLSVWLLPHTLLPWGWLRMANLVVGPVISGLVSRRIAQVRQVRHPHRDLDPNDHGLLAASACLGLVLVRFVACGR